MTKLNRFTTLPILIDLLEREKLVLIEPTTWDDKNDTLLIETYKKRAKVDKLFVMCFTYEAETIHHWKAFANGNSGCCIEFDRKKLIDVFDTNPQLKHRIVDYPCIKSVDELSNNTADIPFTKRYPYKLENEYRVFWDGKSEDSVFEIPISIDSIRKITFAQQMPESIFHSLEKMLESRYPLLKGKINHSTIYENKEWVKKFEMI
jgi:hypothetical protein